MNDNLSDLSGGGWGGHHHRGWRGYRYSAPYLIDVSDQPPTWCWIAVGVAALLLVMSVAGRR